MKPTRWSEFGAQRKSAVAADRLAGSIEDLTAAARRFFDELAPHLVKLPNAA
jgi:hypothetical protein